MDPTGKTSASPFGYLVEALSLVLLERARPDADGLAIKWNNGSSRLRLLLERKATWVAFREPGESRVRAFPVLSPRGRIVPLLSVRRGCSHRRTEGPVLWRRDAREQPGHAAAGPGEPVGRMRALVTTRATCGVAGLRGIACNESNAVLLAP